MIDGMFQQGTDAALDDRVRRPLPAKPVEPPVFGTDFFTAPFRGIGGGTAKSMAFGAEISGAFGQVLAAGGTDSAGGMFSLQSTGERQSSERARSVVLKTGPSMSNPVGDAFRQRAADILPDPNTASKSAQVVSGLADFATRAVGYTVALGPAGPLAFGGDTALEESDRLKQAGVDMATRTKAGAVAGVINAAAVVAPMGGATPVARFVTGTAVGESAMVGQSVAERAILKAAGYDKLAESFDPLDPVNIALGVVPGALGARFGGKPMKVPKTEADMRVAAAFTPEEQARSMAYETSATNLASLQKAIDAEKRPEVKVMLQGELEKLQAQAGHEGVAAAVRADPELVDAVRVRQVADAVESSRLTRDTDLPARDAHLSAVEMAHDQMARGDPVEVRAADISEAMQPRTVLDVSAETRPGLNGLQEPVSARLQTESGLPIEAVRLSRGKYEFRNEQGERVGAMTYTDAGLGGGWKVAGVEVAPELRRQGIATAMYDFVERRVIGEPFQRAGGQSADGAAFRAARDERRAAMADRRLESTATAADQLRVIRERIEPGAKAGEPKASKAPAEPSGASQERGKGKAEGDGAGAVDRAATEAAAFDPEMLVHLEGMDAPMRAGELLDRIRKEAADDVANGRLLEVAAACDLRS